MGALRPLTTDEGQSHRQSHGSKHYVYIDIPPTVFACQVNQGFSSLDYIVEVDYDNVTVGSYTNVIPGMTCYVGSEPGAWDLGIVRIRKSPTTSKLYVGEHADTKWANNVYLTVVDEMFFWAKFPRTFATGEVRMDWDIEYSDQHHVCAPVPVLGSDVVELWRGEPIEIPFDASNSWSPSAGSLTYSWSGSGVSFSSSSSATPVVTVSSPGRYRIRCQVSRGDASWNGYRYIYVVTKDDLLSLPYEIIDPPTGNRDSGGWEWSLRISGSMQTLSKYREGMKVFLFAEDWYGGGRQSFGPQLGRESIIVQGWIAGLEPTAANRLSGGSIDVEIQHPGYWLQQVEGFIDGIESIAGEPESWTEIAGLTLDKCLWHLITWRSTISSVIDVYKSGDSRGVKELQAGAGSLWDQLTQNAEPFTAICCTDRYSRLFVFQEQQTIPVSSRTSIPQVWDISRSDWESLQLERRPLPTVSMINLSGVVHTDGHQPKAIFSLAAGHSFKRFGESRIFDHLALSSQSQSNQLAGLLLGWYNVQWVFDIRLGWNFRMIDIAPSAYLGIHILEDDTPRQIEIDSRLVPREIMIDISEDRIQTEIRGEIESFPENSTDGDIPESPDSDLSSPRLPPFPPPPPPIWIYPPPIVENNNHPRLVIGWTYPHGFLGTSDFHNIGPTWYAMNNGLSSSDYESVGGMVVTPSGAIYAIVNGGIGALGWARVVRAATLGATWETVFEATEEHADASISGIGVNPFAPDHVAIIAGQNYVNFGTLDTSHIWVGTGGSFSQGDISRHKYAYYVKGLTFWEGGWHVTGHRPTGIGGSLATPRMWRYDPEGSLDLVDVDGASWGTGAGATVGHMGLDPMGDKLLAWGGNVTGYSIINDVEATSVSNITDQIRLLGAAMSPLGLKGMGVASAFGPPMYITTDGASSWQSATGTIPLGSDVVENCRDDNRWIFGGGLIVRLTLNQGAFYYDKMGNMPLIAPMTDVRILRYISS